MGLLDHAESVRLTTLDVLMEIARSSHQAPRGFGPIAMLVDHMFEVTVDSGYRENIFQFLVKRKDRRKIATGILFMIQQDRTWRVLSRGRDVKMTCCTLEH